MRTSGSSLPRCLFVVLFASPLLLGIGCVEREATIRSVPPDADLFVDGIRVGQTPVTLPFDEYGVREVVLRKSGYHVTRRLIEMEEPYFQRFPYDLYYEVLTKDLYRDSREYQFVLEPNTKEDLDQSALKEPLLKQADELRKR